jgi:hypothetical protein
MPRSPFKKKNIIVLPPLSSLSNEKVLSDFFKHNDGRVVNARRAGQRLNSLVLAFFWLAVAVVLVGLIGVGLMLFVPPPDNKFGEEMIDFSIQGPEKIAAGELFSYVLSYKNNSALALEKTDISLFLPIGFILDKKSPPALLFSTAGQIVQDADTLNFSLGRMPALQNGELKISGMLVGKEGEGRIMRGVFMFKPEKFHVEFRKTSFASTSLLAPAFKLVAEPSSVVAANQVLPVSFTVTNQSKNSLTNVVVIFSLPDDLTIEEVDPVFYQELFGEKRWVVASLPAQGRWEGQARFKLKQGLKVLPYLNLKSGILEGKEIFVAEEQNISLFENAKDISLILSINGSQNNDPINFSSWLKGSVSLQNMSKADISDLALHLEAGEEGGDLLEWDKLESTPKVELISISSSSGKLTRLSLTKQIIKSFALLKSQDKVTFDFQVPVIGSGGDKISFSTPLKIASTISATFKQSDKEVALVGNTITNILNSDFTFKVQESGEEPLSHVFFSAFNSLHELKDLQANIALGPAAAGVGELSVEAGEIRYDLSKRQITWALNRFPKGINELKGSFEITVISGQGDKGKPLILINSFSATAHDLVTGGTITSQGGTVTF